MKVVDKRFTFMESYYLSIGKIKNDLDRLKFYEAVVRYGLYQQEIQFDSDIEQAYFEEMKAHINISNHIRDVNSKNGQCGGAPKGNDNARKNKRKQAKTSENKPIEKNGMESNGIQSNKKKELYKQLPSVLVESLVEFEKMRSSIKKPVSDRARQMILRKLQEYSNGDLDIMIEILNQSIINCWKDVYPLKEVSQQKRKGFTAADIVSRYAGKE